MRINMLQPGGSLFGELDRGLNHFVNHVFSDRERTLHPPVTVVEQSDRFVIECDLPGVSPDEIQLEVQDGILQISGERTLPHVPDGSTVQYDERAWGSYSRRVKLDRTVDASRIEADYRDGVLIITAARSEEQRPRRVTVRHAEPARVETPAQSQETESSSAETT